MIVIQAAVQERRVQIQGAPQIVCGNSDYSLSFTFDSEWDAYENKTAQFVYRQQGCLCCDEIIFSGDTVQVPALYGTDEVYIGVCAGDIRSTTAARIPCIPGSRDGLPAHDAPTPDVYSQLITLLTKPVPRGNILTAGVTVPLLRGAVGIGGVIEEV